MVELLHQQIDYLEEKVMAARILSGKEYAAKIKEAAKREADSLGICLGLAVVMVGDNPASAVYVRNKNKACEELGSPRALNMVLLGAALHSRVLPFSVEEVDAVMRKTVRESFRDLNSRALRYFF